MTQSSENSGPLLREHDYIGLSEVSSAPPAKTSASDGEYLVLGLGLGLELGILTQLNSVGRKLLRNIHSCLYYLYLEWFWFFTTSQMQSSTYFLCNCVRKQVSLSAYAVTFHLLG